MQQCSALYKKNTVRVKLVPKKATLRALPIGIEGRIDSLKKTKGSYAEAGKESLGSYTIRRNGCSSTAPWSLMQGGWDTVTHE